MSFKEIIGQPVALSLLRRHLKENTATGAYLFTGQDGVGKRFAALEFAKALNCENSNSDSCGLCNSCKRISEGKHPDVHVLLPQGALESIRIDEVRSLIGKLSLKPFMSRFQVAIIDGADLLTEEAANSLLKVLEEPSAKSIFILSARQPSACLPTIVSRCQVVRFQHLSCEAIASIIEKLGLCEPDLAMKVSRLCNGSLSYARFLISNWQKREEIKKHLSARNRIDWIKWPSPTDRDELEMWLLFSTEHLRNLSVSSVRAGSLVGEPQPPDFKNDRLCDPDRYIEAAIQCLHLKESLGHLISTRIVGSLFKEVWIDLLEGKEARIS